MHSKINAANILRAWMGSVDPAETNHSHAPTTARTPESHFASVQLVMDGALELENVDSAQLSCGASPVRPCPGASLATPAQVSLRSCTPNLVKDNVINMPSGPWSCSGQLGHELPTEKPQSCTQAVIPQEGATESTNEAFANNSALSHELDSTKALSELPLFSNRFETEYRGNNQSSSMRGSSHLAREMDGRIYTFQ